MGLLDIVDDNDNIIGEADFLDVHKQGLRHRSVQVFVFENEEYNELLVAQLSRNRGIYSGKFGPSAGGHVKKGQSYFEAAKQELQEELFYNLYLPNEIELIETSHFKNDDEYLNNENSCLFIAHYSGPFSPDPKETERVFWQDSLDLWKDMEKNPDKYTKPFINSMNNYLF